MVKRKAAISQVLIPIVIVISCIGLSIVSMGITGALSQTDLEKFRSDLNNIVKQSENLTESYNVEIGKWLSKQYDNSTLVSKTDLFVPKFESLVKSAENMTYPTDFKYVHEALVNSLNSETESYKHFRNYLLSGNNTENTISIDFLSIAYQYEQIYSRFLSEP
jgi:hypothetical protein